MPWPRARCASASVAEPTIGTYFMATRSYWYPGGADASRFAARPAYSGSCHHGVGPPDPNAPPDPAMISSSYDLHARGHARDMHGDVQMARRAVVDEFERADLRGAEERRRCELQRNRRRSRRPVLVAEIAKQNLEHLIGVAELPRQGGVGRVRQFGLRRPGEPVRQRPFHRIVPVFVRNVSTLRLGTYDRQSSGRVSCP